MSLRPDLRAAARAAVAVALAGYTLPRKRPRKLDMSVLPWAMVTTPTERRRADEVDGTERRITLTVTLLRAGGTDPQDDIDADAVALEGPLLAALEAVAGVDHAEITGVETEEDVDSVTDLAILQMSAEVVAYGDRAETT
jgi:hypothetical protein